MVLLLITLAFIITTSETLRAAPFQTATLNTALETTIYIDPSAITVKAYRKFLVNVSIYEVIDLYGWEFKLKWNSTLLDVLNVTEGDFLKAYNDTFFVINMNNTDGYTRVACTLMGNIGGVNGSGVLAQIEFKAENRGESALELYDTKLVNSSEESISHTVSNGKVTITEGLLGDINGDGMVNILDAIMLSNAFGSRLGDANWNPDADLNDDDIVNILDAIILAGSFGETV